MQPLTEILLANEAKGSTPLSSEADIVKSRQIVRVLTQQLKFSLVDQTKFITAASELSRNTLVYGGGGDMDWEILNTGMRTGLQLKFRDQGPGIPDMEMALTDGWTSGKGMGLGLSGSRRLVHEFEIESELGKGTCVSVTRWK